MSFDDFDVLSILGNSLNCASFKARDKNSGKLVVLEGVHCENLSENEKNQLLRRINVRIKIDHPNVVNFFNFVEQKEAKLIYLIKEYCELGTLQNLIDVCMEKNQRIHEEFACKILYQIAFAFKTLENYFGKISAKEILLDTRCNIKLYNFSTETKNIKQKDPKMSQLGLVMFELCFLEKFDKNSYEKLTSELAEIYSNSFINLIIHMVKDSSDLKKNINKILCHPTILMKSSQWSEERCFFKFENIRKKSTKEDEEICSDSLPYSVRLEKIRNKELALQIKEQKLLELEHKLSTREKKIQIMEKTLKDKLQQAELYLKRCRETKSMSSGASSKNSTKSTKTLQENLDSTYVSCGDSIILPTSSKLNVEKIVKPPTFTRALSERRVRFKGHSPLKDKRPVSRHSSRISRADIIARHEEIKRKPLACKNVYENVIENNSGTRPISWTEENKKYAFDLLRMMNESKENSVEIIRHTHL